MPENQKQKKGSNPGTMVENSKQKKELNPGTMSENPKQKKGSNPSTMSKNPKQKKGSNVSKGAKKGLCPSLRHQYHVRITAHKVKVTKLEILQTLIPEEKPSSLIHNIQYLPTTDRGYAPVCTPKTQISR